MEPLWQVTVRMRGEGYATRTFWVHAQNQHDADQKGIEEFTKLLSPSAKIVLDPTKRSVHV